MKRTAYIFVLTALAAMSCSRNDVNEVDTSYDIIYDVMAQTNTKAAGMTANDYPADVPFGVWAYSLPAGKRWERDKGEAVLVMDNVKSEHVSGREWRPENGQEWGPADENMNFFAASPYGRADFSPDGGIRIESYSLDEDDDLMIVEGLLDQNKEIAKGHVTFTFTRPLADVSFHAQMSLPQGHGIKVRKLILSNVMTEGNFASEPVRHWITEGEPSTVSFFEGEMDLLETALPLCTHVPMIPQAMETELTLICDISNGVGVLTDQVLKTCINMNWGVGKHCSYTLKVTHNLDFTAEKGSY